jgi:hypothetical protein
MKTPYIVGITLASVLLALTAATAGLALSNEGGTSATPVAATLPSATTAPTVTQAVRPKVRHHRAAIIQPVAPQPPVVQPRSSVTYCGGQVSAGADTSCPFAQNVAADYTGTGLDEAYSPVTGETYDMNCSGSDPVVCTGGDNAFVEFYG